MMEAQNKDTQSLPPPPGVISSLKAGFDAISTHISVILLPLVLDVLLWLGPRLSLEKLFVPLIADMIELTKASGFPARDVQMITTMYTRMGEQSGYYNLLGILRTFPVGISSLMADKTSQSIHGATPLGWQNVVQISSFAGLFGWMILLTLIGWIGGGVYFRWVVKTTSGGNEAVIGSGRAITQTFILSIIWLTGIFALMVPVSMILAVLGIFSTLLVQLAVFILLFFSFWLVVPLFFTPHGIFVHRQNAFISMFASLRMARFTLPTSSLFVLSVFFLSQGLNYLWGIPPNDSWMTLVGIAGHAFITTALLAASFIYYRDMSVWLQAVVERLQQANKPARQA